MLTRDEIAGVMAHELGHVRNRDTLIMTMTATIAGAISMLANFGMFFGHQGNRQNGLATLAAVLPGQPSLLDLVGDAVDIAPESTDDSSPSASSELDSPIDAAPLEPHA